MGDFFQENMTKEDELKIHCENYKKELDLYKEFVKYLAEEAINDTRSIIDEFYNVERKWFIGYITGEKFISSDNKLFIRFVNENNEKIAAEWQPSCNYAVRQWVGMSGDDYMGYMLFPCWGDKYFCLKYYC